VSSKAQVGETHLGQHDCRCCSDYRALAQQQSFAIRSRQSDSVKLQRNNLRASRPKVDWLVRRPMIALGRKIFTAR
jgi:hypothetical protein